LRLAVDGLHGAWQPSTRGMEPAKLKAAFGDRLVFKRLH